jgi:hypothetical protein
VHEATTQSVRVACALEGPPEHNEEADADGASDDDYMGTMVVRV